MVVVMINFCYFNGMSQIVGMLRAKPIRTRLPEVKNLTRNYFLFNNVSAETVKIMSSFFF